LKKKLPRIGEPYRNANVTWRIARWFIPIALTVWAFHSYLNPPESFGSNFEINKNFSAYKFDHEALLQIALSLIPTIFLYRIFIALGERLGKSRPRTGALVAVFLVATIPPFMDHLLIKNTLNNLDYVSAIPKLDGQTILLESQHRGKVNCDETCLRLLFSANVENVLITQDISRTSKLVGFYLENTKSCIVELLSGYTGFRNRKSEAIIIGETGGNWSALSTADRVFGQIAQDKCIYSKSYKNPDIDIVFRPSVSKYDVGFVDSFSTYGLPMPWLTIIQESATNGGKKILQLNGNAETINRMNYPTALIYGHRHWASFHYYYKKNEKRKSRPKTFYDKLNDLGLSFQQPEYIGWTQTEAILAAALNDKSLPKSDPRFQLARQYIDHGMKSRFGELDRDMLIRIITDLRISGEAFRSLSGVVSESGNEDIAIALMQRIIDLPSHDKAELQYASGVLHRDADSGLWPVILPMVRQLIDDGEKLRYVMILFEAYEAGNKVDVEQLLSSYKANVDAQAHEPIHRHPVPNDLRKRGRIQQGNISATIIGLCALADKSDKILPSIIESARLNVPADITSNSYRIWSVLSQFDVDLPELAEQSGANQEQLKFVKTRFDTKKSKKCGA